MEEWVNELLPLAAKIAREFSKIPGLPHAEIDRRFNAVARVALRKLVQMNRARVLQDLAIPPGNQAASRRRTAGAHFESVSGAVDAQGHVLLIGDSREFVRAARVGEFLHMQFRQIGGAGPDGTPFSLFQSDDHGCLVL